MSVQEHSGQRADITIDLLTQQHVRANLVRPWTPDVVGVASPVGGDC